MSAEVRGWAQALAQMGTHARARGGYAALRFGGAGLVGGRGPGATSLGDIVPITALTGSLVAPPA